MRPVVLVTGGSRGIGLAIAQGFACRGRDLFLVARDAQSLRAAAAAAEARFGVQVDYAALDLTQPGAVQHALAAVAASGGYVDVLVNCAGTAEPGSFATSNVAAARTTRALNIEVASDLMHACLPGMVARRAGGVINVASLAGMTPMPYLALYAATKSYLVALSRAVASELAGTGVTISVLLPGPVATDFFTETLEASWRRIALLPALSPEAVARTAIEGHLSGQTVITPGLFGGLCRLALNLLPYRVLAPVMRRVLGRPAVAVVQPSAPLRQSVHAPARPASPPMRANVVAAASQG